MPNKIVRKDEVIIDEYPAAESGAYQVGDDLGAKRTDANGHALSLIVG